MSNLPETLAVQLKAVLETITEIEGQHCSISRDEARTLIAVVDRLADVTSDIRATLIGLDQLDRGEFVDFDDLMDEVDRIIEGKAE